MRKSEFGRGYATSLIQFVFHAPRLNDDVVLYAEMRLKEPKLFSPAHAAEMWASGASDHLYDLIRPRSGVTKADWLAAKRVAERALDIGHGFHYPPVATPDECYELIQEAQRLLKVIAVTTFDQAFDWDTAHGIKPSKGYSATCVKPMESRIGFRIRGAASES